MVAQAAQAMKVMVAIGRDSPEKDAFPGTGGSVHPAAAAAVYKIERATKQHAAAARSVVSIFVGHSSTDQCDFISDDVEHPV